MILTLDRSRGVIYGGGTVARVDPDGSVLQPWCRAALEAGWDLQGMALELWDLGCVMGDWTRTHGILCATVADAGVLLSPTLDRARAVAAEQKRAEKRKARKA